MSTVRTQLVSPIFGMPTQFYYPSGDDMPIGKIVHAPKAGFTLFLSIAESLAQHHAPYVYLLSPSKDGEAQATITQEGNRFKAAKGAFLVIEKYAFPPPPKPPMKFIIKNKPVEFQIIDRKPTDTSRFKAVNKYSELFKQLIKDGNGILCPKGTGGSLAKSLRRWLTENGRDGYASFQRWPDGDMVFWRTHPNDAAAFNATTTNTASTGATTGTATKKGGKK